MFTLFEPFTFSIKYNISISNLTHPTPCYFDWGKGSDSVVQYLRTQVLRKWLEEGTPTGVPTMSLSPDSSGTRPTSMVGENDNYVLYYSQ